MKFYGEIKNRKSKYKEELLVQLIYINPKSYYKSEFQKILSFLSSQILRDDW